MLKNKISLILYSSVSLLCLFILYSAERIDESYGAQMVESGTEYVRQLHRRLNDLPGNWKFNSGQNRNPRPDLQDDNLHG